MRYQWLALLVAVIGSAAAQAESAYISDRLTTAINPAPDDIGPALKRLEAGTPVEVIARHERFARVRDKTGAEGWIDARHLVAEPPARQQLGKLQEELKVARTQLTEARGKLKEMEVVVEQEARKNKELAKGLAEAKAAPPPAPAAVMSEPPPAPVANSGVPDTGFHFSVGWLLISFAMLVVGFVAGARWLKEKIRRRSGGMYLRV
ncbi:MAG: TIGR04211 family SH3 domain-containing protein [Pseudomonadota bacterium]|nr:MAG: TIGR04211 family SH3 domain-containing protein [Pseudomonadota bacterium]